MTALACLYVLIFGVWPRARSLSERGIIAAGRPRSTNNFNYLWSVSALASSQQNMPVSGCQKSPFLQQKYGFQRGFGVVPRASAQVHPGNFSLADLVDVGRAGIDRGFTIRHPLAVDFNGALLDHAKRLGGAGHETSFF